MAEDYQNPDLVKATVTVEKELYTRVSGHLHYGQLSKLLRNIFESIDVKIKQGRLMDVVKYIYNEQDLVLTPTGGNNCDDIDGKNQG